MFLDVGAFYLIDHRLIALVMVAVLVAADEVGYRLGLAKLGAPDSLRTLMSGIGHVHGEVDRVATAGDELLRTQRRLDLLPAAAAVLLTLVPHDAERALTQRRMTPEMGLAGRADPPHRSPESIPRRWIRSRHFCRARRRRSSI